MGPASVQVLLSTYNGQKYIEEQMDSVLNQDYPELGVLVRDDGSTDATLTMLEKYAGIKNVQIFQGKNIGVVRSFFALLEVSSPEMEYIAFCDQDDVWLKDKVSRAIGNLKKYGDTPAMYCSRVTLADENLKILGYSQIPRREPSFANALVQNVATGCTIIINNAARQLLLKELPSAILIHDWWIYLVVSAFGKVIYDEESKILYRQHSLNMIGEKSGLLAKWLRRIKRFLKQGRIPFVTVQAEEFHRIFGDYLPAGKKLILDRFINERSTFMGRLRYALRGETYRQSKLDDLIYRILIIFGRI
ncbi:MAG: glycosyltransferase family 2 protein [Dethiobacter sp.]|nr:glycosyltransferase family 2 protein [Dethiobacter sp.]MBS4007261.1 glycosyltransferase family 2 protein [Clostridium sp.]